MATDMRQFGSLQEEWAVYTDAVMKWPEAKRTAPNADQEFLGYCGFSPNLRNRDYAHKVS